VGVLGHRLCPPAAALESGPIDALIVHSQDTMAPAQKVDGELAATASDLERVARGAEPIHQ